MSNAKQETIADIALPNKMSAIEMVRFCETADDWIAMICNQCKIRRPSKASYWFNVCEAVFESIKGQTTPSERLAEVVEICNREIACRHKTAARCEMCREDSSAGEDCPYNGEPCGCNSPTYGEFPSEKDCEPFEEILRAAKGAKKNPQICRR